MNLYKIKGFTFIELIIVVIILTIIGFIGFYSFVNYLQGSRDSSKITALNNIKTTLVAYKLNKGVYLVPTNSSTITYSGAIIWNQGTFGKEIIDKTNLSKDLVLDPYTKNEYTYSVTYNKKSFQIAGVLEKTNKAIVLGDYNGRILNIKYLGKDNILSLPSIIASDLSSTDLGVVINNNLLVYNNSYNIPSSYIDSIFKSKGENLSSNNLILFSGKLSDFIFERNRLKLLNSVKNSYKGTIVANIGKKYFQDINIDLNNPSLNTLAIACDLIEFDLNYPISCNNDSFFAIAIFNIDLSNIDFSGLISQNVNIVFQDNIGNIWFGTDIGLSKYSSGIWTSYTTGNGLIDNSVNNITQTTNGNVWVGTDGGISVFNSSSGIWTSYTTGNGLVNNEIQTVVNTSNGNIWVATEKGISVFDPISGNWTPYTDILVSTDVKNIFQDSNGNIWISTDKGANMFDGVSWIQYTVTDGLISNNVKSIFQDNNGIIWFITKKGLSKLENGIFTNYPNTNNSGIYVVYQGAGITVIGIN